MCVETLAVTATRTWRRYLDWAQCCEAIYICVCVSCENSFFSACGNCWPYVLDL